MANSLSKLIQDQVAKRNIQELHICRRSPGASHLLFADGTLLFIQATEDQATRIKEVLSTFEKCTSQLINPLKCSMMFGRDYSMTNKDKVLDILRVPNTTTEEKYLGLPTPEGRMNKEKFKTTKQRLVNRCSSWAEKNMSMAVREVLIKSIAQAIPTYTMGVYKMLGGACDEITQLIRRFWWGEEGGKRKVHWMAWDKLLAPKSKGGIGF
jgi:hypothetical protein